MKVLKSRIINRIKDIFHYVIALPGKEFCPVGALKRTGNFSWDAHRYRRGINLDERDDIDDRIRQEGLVGPLEIVYGYAKGVSVYTVLARKLQDQPPRYAR